LLPAKLAPPAVVEAFSGPVSSLAKPDTHTYTVAANTTAWDAPNLARTPP
jgi:hypothetical protein